MIQMKRRGLTRREILQGGGVAVMGAGGLTLAVTSNWTGHPVDKPAVAARINPAGGSVVYASWNGATEADTWTVLAGTAASALSRAGSQRRSGFETAITVNTVGPFFAVTAQDSQGRTIGRSATVQVEK
jgi:hypothetical protein